MHTKIDIDKQLITSFKKLVLKEPVEKITIKEITDEAGVIRPTFYNHFQDKYEVIERIVKEEIFEPVRPLLDNDMINEAMILIFTNVYKDKEFYQKLSQMDGQNSFASIVKDSITVVLEEFITDRVGSRRWNNVWLTPKIIARYYAQSMSFIVLEWIDSGMIISPVEMAKVYHYVISRSMDDVLKEMEETE